MATHPRKEPDNIPFVKVTEIKKTVSDCDYLVMTVSDAEFQDASVNMAEADLSFESNAIYFRLNNSGYRFQLKSPPAEITQKVVYVY